MPGAPSVDNPFFRRLPLNAGVVAGLIGSLALGGWLAGVPALATYGPGLPPMAVPVAVGVVMLGASLALLAPEAPSPARRRIGLALAALVLVMGGLVMAGAAREAPGALTSLPLAMPMVVLLAFALITLDRDLAMRPRPAEVAALAAGALAAAPLLAYSSSSAYLYALTTKMGMALPSALAGFALASGILLARPRHGLAAPLMAAGAAGEVARRLFPAVLAIPLMAIALRWLLERFDLANTATGASIMVLSLIGLGYGLLLWNGNALERAEEARHRSEAERAMLAAFVAATDDAIVGTSPDGTIKSWNQAAETLFGYRAVEMIGASAERAVPADRRGEFAYLLSSVAAGRRFQNFETVLLRIDGTPFDASLTVSPVMDADGRVTGIVTVIRDVSERHRLESELRFREAELRGLVESAPDAVLVLDERDRVDFVNPRAEVMFGRRRGELAGMALGELVSGPIGGGGGSAAADAPPVQLDAEGIRLDGSHFPVEISRARVDLTEGTFRVAFVRDITERKQAAETMARHAVEIEQARELARIKDHIFSTISHETKTPLSLIQGYAELLQDQYPEEELLHGLLDGVSRVTSHIEAMLDYAALLGGQMPLYRALVDPAELVESLRERLAERFEVSQLHFEADLPEDLPAVNADPRRLDQVLAILLDNAIKFTPAGGRIGVRARAVGDEVRIAVWDTGPGLSPDAIARIGEPFHQERIGDTERSGGLGLGLATVKKLVELHGGTFVITSEPGKGSTFEVRLPVPPTSRANTYRT